MRFAVFATILMLAGCATRPDGVSTSSYRGVHVAGGASIADDGSFTSAAGVWKADDLAVAKDAAITRLTLAAVRAGYTHVSVTSEKSGPFIGHQYRLTGKLYKARGAPDGAWPIGEIAKAIGGIGAEIETAKAIPPEQKSTAPARVKKPVQDDDLPETNEEPLVIEAPDFITAVPLRRPVG